MQLKPLAPFPGAIARLDSDLDQELAWTPRQLFPEACGLAAAIHVPNAATYTYDSLVLQEHRGEHGVGIVSVEDKDLHVVRRTGVVREQFVNVSLKDELPGQVAIGHTRYATRGRYNALENVQPIVFRHTRFGPLAIAHNGTLLDDANVTESLLSDHVVLQTTSDTEIFGHCIVQSEGETLIDAIKEAAQKLSVAYAMLILTPTHFVALRDRYGVRPLSYANVDGGIVFCSENYALDQFPSATDVQEVPPGTMVSIELATGKLETITFSPSEPGFCIFESIYFSDPRSRHHGVYHEDFRFALGEQLYRENPHLTGDIIVPILDSGKHSALGLAASSGIGYRELFKRLHNPPRAQSRSFTSATTEDRKRAAYQKLHLRKESVRGKHIVTVDDSIVRSTTMRIINERLRGAGVARITNVITAPPIVNICPYGIDFQRKSELIAYSRSIEEIRKVIESDELIYLSQDGLAKTVQALYNNPVCSGCFGGSYPRLGQTDDIVLPIH